MAKWEYYVIWTYSKKIDHRYVATIALANGTEYVGWMQIEKWMNEKGEEGWELASSFTDKTIDKHRNVMIFKRQKE